MIDRYIKKLLGFESKTSNRKVKEEWNRRTKNICKPCWELKYCPYGPLVEDFPLLGPTRKEAIEHNDFLKKQLKKGFYKDSRKKIFEKETLNFSPNDYPEKHSKQDLEKSCSVFGHFCPVFFTNEPLTETNELRRIGRSIPRHIMLRVVRRDNNQCQLCGNVLKDDEIEFDHIIPLSKGGSSEESNIRVTCFECNRNKADKLI